MSVIQYWRERLAARNPLYSGSFKAREDYKVRQDRPQDPWPHSVCRAVLYQDYQFWFEDVFLKAYRGVPYYDNSPDKFPTPEVDFEFYSGMSPFLYLVSKEVQVKNYLVPTQRFYEEKWVKGKRYRYFVRLCEWETHVAAFELYTGLSISGNLAFFDVEKAKRMSAEIADFKARLLESPRPAAGG